MSARTHPRWRRMSALSSWSLRWRKYLYIVWCGAVLEAWWMCRWVTKVLPRCYQSVSKVLIWCYHGVTKVLPCCYHGVTRISPCYHGVNMVLPWCYHGVTKVLPRCYHGVTRISPCYHGVTRMLPCWNHDYVIWIPNSISQCVSGNHITSPQSVDVTQLGPSPQSVTEWRGNVSVISSTRARSVRIVEQGSTPLEAGLKSRGVRRAGVWWRIHWGVY